MHKETLHSGVRQYLHRMIICLGDELLNYVPMAITLLLKDCQVSGTGNLEVLSIFGWCGDNYDQTIATVQLRITFEFKS